MPKRARTRTAVRFSSPLEQPVAVPFDEVVASLPGEPGERVSGRWRTIRQLYGRHVHPLTLPLLRKMAPGEYVVLYGQYYDDMNRPGDAVDELTRMSLGAYDENTQLLGVTELDEHPPFSFNMYVFKDRFMDVLVTGSGCDPVWVFVKERASAAHHAE